MERVLLKPFCPPYYSSMSAAVRAYVDYKFSPGGGSLRADTVATAWREPEAVRQSIPGYSDEADRCDLRIYERYGRFPGLSGPFRTLVAYQAHNLDPGFYARFYRPSP